MAEDIQTQAIEFERNRQQLLGISTQKQQLQIQSSALNNALEELEKTKEKKVFKIVGNILIQSEVAATKKELKEKKETMDLRIKTLQKQEDSLVNKLNKLKSEIESAQIPAKEKPSEK
ncbi:MAG: prefoldin subunit beta [Candidatus Diapherotrites archaeon]|nr:prefoldin subunit beta [Candidatus Diapherotrites archaeon]